MTTRRWLLFAGGISVLSTLLLLGISWIDLQIWEAQGRSPLRGLNHEITDLAFQNRAVTRQDSLVSTSEVVIIDIDDASIEKLGRVQIWPRSYDARVVEHVSAGDPATIGVDLLYSEPDTLTPAHERLLREAGFTQPNKILQALRTDEHLAQALRTAETTYLPLFDASSPQGAGPSISTSGGSPTGPTRDSSKLPPDSGSSPLVPTTPVRSGLASNFLRLSHPGFPIAPLREAARGVAPVTLPGGGDGTVRHYPAVQVLADNASPPTERSSRDSETRVPAVPTFSVLMAAGRLGVPPESIRVSREAVVLGSARRIPISRRGGFPINWLGEREKIRRIPFHDVLSGRVPSAFFEDKYVFVGTSASGLGDRFPTPTGRNMPGVAIHAEAFLNIMNRSFPQDFSLWDLWPWLFGGACLLSLLFLALRPLFGAFVVLGLGFAEFFGYVLFFPTWTVILPVGSFLVLTALTYGGSAAVRYLTEERERRRVQEAFSSYVSPELVDQIVDQRERLQLGGEKREMTVLFCDLRGFTGFSERLGPEKVVSFLNRRFDQMSEAILREDGTIDKFIGDAIMAFFGAPLRQEDHALQACRAAIGIQETVEAAAPSIQEDGGVGIGVGISTGEMVVGNIGSSARFDYTVIGDAVNLGSRLERLSAKLGTSILVSGSTVARCDAPSLIFRAVGPVDVKGRDEPVEVFELMPAAVYNDPEALSKRFAEGRDLYEERRFADALSVFEACLQRADDELSRYYAERCRRCLKNPDAHREVIKIGEP